MPKKLSTNEGPKKEFLCMYIYICASLSNPPSPHNPPRVLGYVVVEGTRSVCTFVCLYVCVCMCMYVYVCVCMCMYVYVCVCMCM